MLHFFLYPLRDIWFGFNIFRYITFRAALCGVTAFLFSLLAGPFIIKQLKHFNIKEKILREDAPSLYKYHKDKEGTPTMGGVIIISSIVISTLLWADITNKFILLSILGTVWLGTVGFIDDYIKLKIKSKGLKVAAKLLGQVSIALFIAIVLFVDKNFGSTMTVPFLKNATIDLGLFYVVFAAVVIVAASNAVNITDGLDGLAVGCVIIIAITYGAISYLTGHIKFSQYLDIFYNPGAGELTVFCAAILGSGLGFLWFNAYPATVFMGDTGSLALGGAIGMVAVFIKKELLLFLVGGVFVIETLTVLMQVAFFKLKRKRIFLMAPIHHHFQHKGWPEPKIIIRFWIVAIVLAFLTLTTLKLR